jgi:hypothetical protein
MHDREANAVSHAQVILTQRVGHQYPRTVPGHDIGIESVAAIHRLDDLFDPGALAFENQPPAEPPHQGIEPEQRLDQHVDGRGHLRLPYQVGCIEVVGLRAACVANGELENRLRLDSDPSADCAPGDHPRGEHDLPS